MGFTPFVNTSAELLSAAILDSLGSLDTRITASADAEHAFVKDNYIVHKKCGKLWALDTAAVAYEQISAVQINQSGQTVCM